MHHGENSNDQFPGAIGTTQKHPAFVDGLERTIQYEETTDIWMGCNVSEQRGGGCDALFLRRANI